MLSTSKDLKTSACTAAGRPPQYILDALTKVPLEVKEKFYGCGNPIPPEIEGMQAALLLEFFNVVSVYFETESGLLTSKWNVLRLLRFG